MLKEELIAIRDRFGDARRTEIQDVIEDIEDEAILGVVIAAEGYPGDVVKGNALPNLSDVALPVYHAGTKFVDENYVGNGGRVILVSAEAPTLKEAQQKVYEELGKKQWPNFFYRSDIGWRTFK